jgi:hypothetical protein
MNLIVANGNVVPKIAANDNRKPTKLISFAELSTTRGITFIPPLY